MASANKAAGAPLDAAYGVAFFPIKISQVRAILAGDASDEGGLGGGSHLSFFKLGAPSKDCI